MNRTIKEATVQRYHYDTHEQLRRHLVDFVTAYNFARLLKTLLGSLRIHLQGLVQRTNSVQP